jgi:bla regulator protein BlaR1
MMKSVIFASVALVSFAADSFAVDNQSEHSTERLKFDVASIKPTANEGGKGGLDIIPGGGLRLGGSTLRSLIALAYGVMEDRISGGPNWIGSITYDVLAKPENPHPADIGKTTFAPGTPGWNRMQQRLQSLLEDRFQLVLHKDVRETNGYALVIAKGGSKLEQSKSEAPPGTMRSMGRIDGRNGTMEMLSAVLSNFIGRRVEDRTGLTGTYDYKLEYAQETAGNDNPPEFGRASIFTALQEQLGLKLDSSKVPMVTIVIDRVEKLSAN